MTIAVYAVYAVIDGVLVPEDTAPRRSEFQVGDVVGALSSLPERGDGPEWSIVIALRLDKGIQRIAMPIERVLTRAEYDSSHREPFSLAPLTASLRPPENKKDWKRPDWSFVWLFRDVFYVCERLPQPSEIEEVVLRIKALHYERAQEFRRLREQVANYEAVETLIKNGRKREIIPDDVKLLVWSRDGGACVKCGAQTGLQFDHIIPHARGGSDSAENLQLLCDRCNLLKSDRLA